MKTMRNYPQDQCDDLDQIPRYVRNKNTQQKGLHRHTRAPPNQANNWTTKAKSSEKTSLDLVPNYEQPALPYYVVPVLYVPQKVLSNEEILPSNSFQSKHRSLFGGYVRQTKQQRLIMAEDYDIPFVTCSTDPQTVIDYKRDPQEIFADYYAPPGLVNKSNLDDGDYNEEEEVTEVEEEEEQEVEYINYEGEYTLSTASVREEEEEEEEEEINTMEATVYEQDYDAKPVRYFASHPTHKYYQNNQEYFCSRPNKSQMQILGPPQNYQYKPNNYSYIPLPRANTVANKMPPLLIQGGPINYGGDVYRNQIFRNPNFEQPSQNDFAGVQTFHDSIYETDPRASTVAKKMPPLLLQGGSINYGGDVYRNQIFRNPNFEQPSHNDFAGVQTFHDSIYETDPFYYENHQVDHNLTARHSDFKPKTNYTLMQRSEADRTTQDKLPEVWPSTDQGRELKPEKRLTCEDILRNYMQEKQISLESLRKTSESVVSDGTASTKKSSPSFNTPPCKESPSKETDIIDDVTILEVEAPAKLESRLSIKSSSNLKRIDPDDVKTKLSCTESSYTQSVNSSTLSTSIANTNSKEQTDSALANFVKTLSLTVIAAKTSSESSTLKNIPSKNNSLKETGMKSEEQELCSITATSQSILDTKSTQTIIDSLAATTTSTVSTQTEQKSIVPDEKEVDLGKLLQSRESNRTLPDIDIFKPLTKPRDLSPSTFFQKYRKQIKPYAGVDHVKEKRSKLEGSQQRLSPSRSPSKAPPANQSKTKKAKKK